MEETWELHYWVTQYMYGETVEDSIRKGRHPHAVSVHPSEEAARAEQHKREHDANFAGCKFTVHKRV